MKDWLICSVVKGMIFLMRFLPIEAWLTLARCFGRVYYYSAGRRNSKARANLVVAFKQCSASERNRIIKEMYVRFAQNLVEALYLSLIDERYVKEHIRVVNPDVVREALQTKRSIIFLGSHAGSWELSNIACAMLFKKAPYAMLAQPQVKYKKLDAFLNRIRETKGCQVIRVGELRKLITHLSKGAMLGVVADHGGRDGIPVEFFGKLAMTPTGSLRLARKTKAKIILAFMRRIKGPYHEMIFEAYEPQQGSDEGESLKKNLTEINGMFEGWIRKYPQEYLWFYRRWKHSPVRDILLLSDGKAGHQKQCLSLVEMISSLGFFVRDEVVTVNYRSAGLRSLLFFSVFFFGSRFPGFLLSLCLDKETSRRFESLPYDMVVSAGSRLSAVNLLLASRNNAKSLVLMRPGIFGISRFDLVIMPEHDTAVQKKNLVRTMGSVNTVSASSIAGDFEDLVLSRRDLTSFTQFQRPKIGLLLGGNSKNYELTPELTAFLCRQIKRVLDETLGVLFLTTSRRTPGDVVDVLKKAFENEPRCKLFVEAARDNPRGTVGGIFYLSDIVIVTGESISMVSEALNSGRYVVVFEPRRKTSQNKVERFLKLLAQKGYIYLRPLNQIYGTLCWIIENKPERKTCNTQGTVLKELARVI